MKRLAMLAVALTLAGCATAPLDPQVITKEVPVPVAVKCVPNPPVVAPDFADTDAKLKAAPTEFDNAKARVIGRLQRIGYEGELVAALNACTG